LGCSDLDACRSLAAIVFVSACADIVDLDWNGF
jgi:hypothetical protein